MLNSSTGSAVSLTNNYTSVTSAVFVLFKIIRLDLLYWLFLPALYEIEMISRRCGELQKQRVILWYFWIRGGWVGACLKQKKPRSCPCRWPSAWLWALLCYTAGLAVPQEKGGGDEAVVAQVPLSHVTELCAVRVSGLQGYGRGRQTRLALWGFQSCFWGRWATHGQASGTQVCIKWWVPLLTSAESAGQFWPNTAGGRAFRQFKLLQLFMNLNV